MGLAPRASCASLRRVSLPSVPPWVPGRVLLFALFSVVAFRVSDVFPRALPADVLCFGAGAFKRLPADLVRGCFCAPQMGSGAF